MMQTEYKKQQEGKSGVAGMQQAVMARVDEAGETDKEVLVRFERDGPWWGLSTAVTLLKCNPVRIRDPSRIQGFVDELCVRIRVQKHGSTFLDHFGEDDRVTGHALGQLIQTSSFTR